MILFNGKVNTLLMMYQDKLSVNYRAAFEALVGFQLE